ncbi:MAG: UDP-N-acetylmuramoyl-L-alanine--D-glutamate ligase [Verrucomicrobiales bacterium]|nr:UDP-N-acetylmuramoyl-L-alanine--D-glutamate ligase [Verrucomicrobiales bacterium]
MDLTGKQIAILGAGTSGFAASQLARTRGAQSVCVYDSGEPDKLESRKSIFAEIGVETVFGPEALNPPSNLDLTVISPGIDAGWEIGQAFCQTGAPLIGEVEFAWQCRGNVPVIAITGTNGKTTTTELTADILKGAGVRTVAAGNVGTAFCEVVLSGREYDVITVEVSSFQLETIDTFRPSVAVWMNFAPDHMDRYSTVEDYRNAKLRIFENQQPDDFAVIKAGETIAAEAQSITFSAFGDEADFSLDQGVICSNGEAVLDYRKTRLNGKHNAENVMAAMAATHSHGLEFNAMVETICGFQAPPHRCEVVCEVSSVTYVNDSKATNLHALESSLRGQEEPVVLIVGGKDKGLDYSELSGLIPDAVTKVICIGEMATRIAEAWHGRADCKIADSLESAVALAASSAKPGQVVLFSPGTSSFDMFSGYEERGEVFRKAVYDLK